MIRCSECGHENMDGLEYCDACGAKLPVGAPAEPLAAAAPEAAPVVASEPPPVEVSAPAEAAIAVAPPAPTPAVSPSTGPVQNAQLTILRGGTVGKVFPLQAGLQPFDINRNFNSHSRHVDGIPCWLFALGRDHFPRVLDDARLFHP